ncbi:MAG: hypothetical protein WAM85_12670 [Terracidiphilus sp.]
MKHLNEEELVDYYYREDNRDGAVTAHLEACAECAAAFAALESDLARIEPLEPPARDDRYGERVWEAIAGSLTARPPRRTAWLHPGLGRSLIYAAACALLLAGTFYAGRQWEHRQTRITAGNTPTAAQQRVILFVLDDHLDRSERLLVELKHADAGDPQVVMPLHDEAINLLATNRVCRKDAKQIDDPALAAALGHLDQVLTGLAGQPGGLDAETIRKLQDQMNAEGLLFEVRVLHSRMHHRGTSNATQPRGGTA